MATVRTVGSSGQISLGKEYAGRHVLVEQTGDGVWVIKAGTFIPDNEAWLQNPKVAEKLDRAISWAAKNPPKKTALDKLEAELKK